MPSVLWQWNKILQEYHKMFRYICILHNSQDIVWKNLSNSGSSSNETEKISCNHLPKFLSKLMDKLLCNLLSGRRTTLGGRLTSWKVVVELYPCVFFLDVTLFLIRIISFISVLFVLPDVTCTQYIKIPKVQVGLDPFQCQVAWESDATIEVGRLVAKVSRDSGIPY